MKLLFLVLLLISSTIAIADEHPCKEDAKKFCSDAKGKKEIIKCMKDHLQELTPECRQRNEKNFERKHEKLQNVLEKCSAEIKKYCNNSDNKNFVSFKCLKSYTDKLSEQCKSAIHNDRP